MKAVWARVFQRVRNISVEFAPPLPLFSRTICRRRDFGAALVSRRMARRLFGDG